jgi:hypothetical protein
MALEADNVNVAVTGAFAYAPTATALPADAITALAVTYKNVGYLDESGVVQSITESSADIKAWQNADIVRTISTEHKLTYKLTLLETNPIALELIAGVAPVLGVMQIKGGVRPHHVFVLDVVDGTSHIRIVIPDGQVSEVGDVTYVNGAPISYPITINCFPDATGVKAYVHYATAGVPAA